MKIKIINIILLIIISILLIIIVINFATHQYSEKFSDENSDEKSNDNDNDKKIVYTCTTYFDFNDNKFFDFCRSLDTFFYYNPMSVTDVDFIIINEYSNTKKKDWDNIIRTKYPFIKFISKDKKDKGQARSLNMILNLIRDYDYWIHIEEAWFCTRPFFNDVVKIMNTSNVSQLSMNWYWNRERVEWNDYYKKQIFNSYVIIDEKPNTLTLEQYYKNGYSFEGTSWSLYSLRPSISRVSDILKIGQFDEHPDAWPVMFEYEFGLKFKKHGLIKAYLLEPAYDRNWTKHQSTYTKTKTKKGP